MRSALWICLAILVSPLAVQAQQPTGPARDTIVVMRRDTVFVVQRDTIFVQPAPRDGDGPARNLPPDRGERGYGGETPEERRERLAETREERYERFRQIREEREAYLEALPAVRASEHAFAVMVYPSHLLEIEFPAVNVGVSYVKNGKMGVMASLGLLTAPVSGRNQNGNSSAQARGPVRGVDLGLEGRLYPSPLRNDFPMYFGFGASYSLAAVTFNRYVPNADFTFSRLQESHAQGRRIRGTAVVGWELRTGGFAIDLTTGLELNGRGIFTSDQGLIREINSTWWDVNSANRYNALLLPIMRLGVGFGKW